MLLDDIAAVLDDVALMTKVAARKTAGVLGDDLALNAQQLMGISARRELPVVWAVAKGSFVNKLILVPLAMLISLFVPWAITPLLMIGGAFLCYEGAEKLLHRFFHHGDGGSGNAEHQAELAAAAKSPEGMAAYEKNKIKGAVRTDFILSAEIVAIALGTVSQAPMMMQLAVISTVAIAVTVGVYGLVGMIVKLDDLGLYLKTRDSGALQTVGGGILAFAPWLMHALSVVGTIAMFLVGGGILIHGIPGLGHWLELAAHMAGGWDWLAEMLLIAVGGILAGAIVVAAVTLIRRLMPGKTAGSES